MHWVGQVELPTVLLKSEDKIHNSTLHSKDKVCVSGAVEDLASKELWKQEKKLRFLIRRCCKVHN